MTDPSDIQSSPPTTPETTSQPPTMHFEAAVPTLTVEDKISALLIQMASISTILETMKTNHDDKLEKYKSDLTNQVKADVILSTVELETRFETIDAKVTEVKTDMLCHDLDIDDLEAFKDDIVPKVDQALSRPASLNTSPNDRNNFPRFSGYMGTRTYPTEAGSA